jgi:hypothetical protein
MKFFGLLSLIITVAIIAVLVSQQMGGKGDKNTARAAEQAAQNATGQANLVNLQITINSYHAAQGKYPETLEELVDKGMIYKIPADVKYDPQTGQVTSTK